MNKRVVSIFIYAVSVAISWKYCAEYWVVGPVFAAACLLSQFEKVKKGFLARHAFFIVASTLTYALVYGLAHKGWRFESDILDMAIGSLSIGVVMGSLLLPFVHGILFSVDRKITCRVSLWLIVSWYGVLAISMFDELLNVPGNINYAFISIALWQGLYLRSLKIS